jgi:carbonic anhydrase/acetyltransferase-like protein (isoleucine patch superfamily)
MPVRNFESILPTIATSAYIAPEATVIGDVSIGDNSSLWPGVVVRGDVNKIIIGERTNIQDNSVCHVTHQGQYNLEGYPLILGNDITIGHRVIVHGCTIKDRCLIGMGAIIMDGAILHKEVMLGAGSLVPPGKELESGFLYVGTPVKKVRELTSEEQEFLQYSANYYAQLKERY